MCCWFGPERQDELARGLWREGRRRNGRLLRRLQLDSRIAFSAVAPVD
jgi:hypothetical protein